MTATIGSRALVLVLALLVVVVAAPGCAAIEGIFKAGMWVGVIVTVAVIGLVLFVVSRISG